MRAGPSSRLDPGSGLVAWLTRLFRAAGCVLRAIWVIWGVPVTAAGWVAPGLSSRPLVCTNGRPSAATLRLLAQLTAGGTTLHVRADDDVSGQEIVAGLRASIPNARLWHYTLRRPDTPRHEEQDLDMLLRKLNRSRASQ